MPPKGSNLDREQIVVSGFQGVRQVSSSIESRTQCLWVEYRKRVSGLIRSLGSAEGMDEAKKALRTLVERIVLTPAAEGTGLDLTLEGDLAGLLQLQHRLRRTSA